MRCIAVMNQKGGCGKTTTVVSLAGCLAAEGHAVLVVDMDPQAHATLGLGVDPEELDENLYEVLAEPEACEVVQPREADELHALQESLLPVLGLEEQVA